MDKRRQADLRKNMHSAIQDKAEIDLRTVQRRKMSGQALGSIQNMDIILQGNQSNYESM